MKKVLALILTLAMALSLASLTACGGSSSSNTGTTDSSAAGDTTDAEESGLPTIDSITLGEDYQDITATVTILTNRTDIADTTYAATRRSSTSCIPTSPWSTRPSPTTRRPSNCG